MRIGLRGEEVKGRGEGRGAGSTGPEARSQKAEAKRPKGKTRRGQPQITRRGADIRRLHRWFGYGQFRSQNSETRNQSAERRRRRGHPQITLMARRGVDKPKGKSQEPKLKTGNCRTGADEANEELSADYADYIDGSGRTDQKAGAAKLRVTRCRVAARRQRPKGSQQSGSRLPNRFGPVAQPAPVLDLNPIPVLIC